MERSRCFRTFWYVRLRSRLKVSRKKIAKRVKINPARMDRNQNIALQFQTVVRTPPHKGPIACSKNGPQCKLTVCQIEEQTDRSNEYYNVVNSHLSGHVE